MSPFYIQLQPITWSLFFLIDLRVTYAKLSSRCSVCFKLRQNWVISGVFTEDAACCSFKLSFITSSLWLFGANITYFCSLLLWGNVLLFACPKCLKWTWERLESQTFQKMGPNLMWDVTVNGLTNYCLTTFPFFILNSSLSNYKQTRETIL